ncbi:MAG: MarR family transcriptional regulator [Pseudomonadota bacterium]
MGDHDDIIIGYLIADTSRLMRTVFDRRMRKLGLTRAQWLALTRLHRQPGVNQSEVADMLEIEKASAGRLIDRLEQNGWVERRADASDRRVRRVHLTPHAERVHEEILPIAEATVDAALQDLSAQERKRLRGYLERVKAAVVAMAGADDEATPDDERLREEAQAQRQRERVAP